MKTSMKIVLITVPLAILAFLASPVGPLGSFWRPAAELPMPSGAKLALFLIPLIAEAVAFGLGISFLFFGYPQVKAFAPVSKGASRAAHLALSWLLLNWWPHDSLHLFIGESMNGLLALEYGFHFTIIVSGLILIAYFLAALRTQQKALA